MEQDERPSKRSKLERLSNGAVSKDTNAPAAPFEQFRILEGHTGAVTSVKISPDGAFAASAGADKTARIWDISTGALQEVLTGHQKGLSDVCWTLDSRLMASASDDKTVRIWDPIKAETLRLLTGHTAFVFCVNFNPKGNILASGSFDETVRIWDVKKGTCMRILPAHSDPVTSVDFSRDGTILASGSYDGLIRLWDASTGHCLKTLIADNKAAVTSVRFSPNSMFLLTASLDSTLRLWNYVTNRVVKTYKGHKNTLAVGFCCFIIYKRPCVIAGSEDGFVYIWDTQTKQVVQRLELPAPTDGSYKTLALDAYSWKEPMVAFSNSNKIIIWRAHEEETDN